MLGWIVETTLVATGLAVVAALAGRLRSIGPTARHLLWLVVLVKLVTPPLVSLALGRALGGPDVALHRYQRPWPCVDADDSPSSPSMPFAEATTLADLDQAAGLDPCVRSTWWSCPRRPNPPRSGLGEADSSVPASLVPVLDLGTTAGTDHPVAGRPRPSAG